MTSIKHYLPMFLLLCSGMISCTNEDNKPCVLKIRISVAKVASHPCSAIGEIQILNPIGSNYRYKIDSQPYQNLPKFLKMKVGKHILMVKNQNGCEATKVVIIDTIAAGNAFNEVRQILNYQCARCHSGLNPKAGMDFTNVCDILKHWERVDARAVQGIPVPMPQGGFIPKEERDKIRDWINMGHLYSN